MNTLILFCAKYLIFIVAALAALALWRDRVHRVELFKLTIVASVLAGLLALLGNQLIADPRPFVVGHFTPLLPHFPDNGFPSDHTVVGMLAGLLVLLNHKKLGVILMALALLVGAARVLAEVHHVEDILGSVVIALVAFAVTLLLQSRIRFLQPQRQEDL